MSACRNDENEIEATGLLEQAKNPKQMRAVARIQDAETMDMPGPKGGGRQILDVLAETDYIQRIIDSLNGDSTEKEATEAEYKKTVEVQISALEQLQKVVAARHLNDPAEAELLVFDAGLDDDEVLLRFFRQVDVDGGGTIGKSELLGAGQFQKSENAEMAKALRRAFECSVGDFEEALVHLTESDFGVYARHARVAEFEEAASVEISAQPEFDRKDTVKALFDAARAKVDPAPVGPTSHGLEDSGLKAAGGITRGQIELAISELQSVGGGEPTGNSHLADALRDLAATLLPSNRNLNFLSLKAAARKVPRVSGQRMEWIRALKLDAALARHLPPGTLDDALEGVRKLSQDKDAVDRLLEAFFDDTRRKFQAALQEAVVEEGSKSAVEANSKFEGFPGNFASLREFDAGAEVTLQLGYPNPDVGKGIRLEHTEHPSVARLFVTPNYRIATCLLVEYWWAMYEECPEDPAVRRVRDRAWMLLDRISGERGGSTEARRLFPGEVGDSFTETLVVIAVPTGGVDRPAEGKCVEAARAAAGEALSTEEEKARGFSVLDHPSCSRWMAQCGGVISPRTNTESHDVAPQHPWSLGVFLPVSKARAENTCEAFRTKIAAAAGISHQSVHAYVHTSRTWVYCEHCTLEEFRKETKALSRAELKSGDWGLKDSRAETHEALCSKAVLWFIREQLRRDFRAALESADDPVLEALLVAWGVSAENVKRLSRAQKIDLAVETLDSEQRWLQVEQWVGHYRGRIKGRVRLGLGKLMQRERSKIEKYELVREEVLGLFLYTGPEYLPMNAICRSFPRAILDLLSGDGSTQRNTLCTTLFCISSGLKKLGRHTELPESRMVYRGLGKMLLPQEFWVPRGTPAWRGGVERAFLSTTADKNVALFYANGRGTVVEISVGRIQIGGDVSFLSMVRPAAGPAYFHKVCGRKA